MTLPPIEQRRSHHSHYYLNLNERLSLKEIRSIKMISIIIPLYNKRETIARTINSVIMQSYQDWELIVIDDGSTDGSDEIVKSFLKDKRIQYILKKMEEFHLLEILGFLLLKVNGLSILMQMTIFIQCFRFIGTNDRGISCGYCVGKLLCRAEY